MEEEKEIKVVVIGDGCVGKSSLIETISTSNFPTKMHPAILHSNLFIQKEGKKITFWDTAGYSDCDRLRSLSYPQSDVIIICFSTVSPSSFENVLAKWICEARHFLPNTPFLILGTKSDLENDQDVISRLETKKLKVLSFDHCLEQISSSPLTSLLFCSAKEKKGLNEVVDMIINLNENKNNNNNNNNNDNKKKNCFIM